MRSVFADAIRVRSQVVDLWELDPKVVGVGPSLDTIQYLLCPPPQQMPALRKQAQSQQGISAMASTSRKTPNEERTKDAHCGGCVVVASAGGLPPRAATAAVIVAASALTVVMAAISVAKVAVVAAVALLLLVELVAAAAVVVAAGSAAVAGALVGTVEAPTAVPSAVVAAHSAEVEVKEVLAKAVEEMIANAHLPW
jgi:hypothetical protein